MDLLTALLIAIAAAGVVAGLVLAFFRPKNDGSALEAALARATQAEAARDLERAKADEALHGRTEAERHAVRFDEAKAQTELRLQELQGRLANAAQETAQYVGELQTLRGEHEHMKAAATKDREFAAKQITSLEETRETMKKEFRVLAEEVMQQHGTTFRDQNREQIEGLLNPLRTKIVEFQQGMEASQHQATEARARLTKQIEMLGARSKAMSAETENLTRALKGQTQVQGAWGEMVLTTILEKSGLRDGDEFVTQQTTTTEEGARLRPDVVVNLPNGHRIVIDAKVSLVAFERLVNADNDADSAQALREHVDSVRNHVRELSGKQYEQVIGTTPDYVIMFVPIEGALAAALGAASELTSFALERNVTIASPTNLMTLLRTVSNLWQVERRNRNAEAIADRAGKLYDKFVGFMGDLEGVGLRLAQATKAHEQALGKLSTGSGNLVRQTELLRNLGAKSSKSLDEEIIEKARTDQPKQLALREDSLPIADEHRVQPEHD
ncbi:MAG: DNA recombination protein RmuC [Chromatiales bacterium]|jgi:DNA recombination protein RmuC|nr:DNA recombination protein RmuC [Chromatiales bacterium]